MQSSASFSTEWSQFDRLVGAVVLGFLLVTALILWRGDRVGVQVMAVVPAEAAADVSARTGLQVTFSQEMAIGSETPLSISPPVSGTVRWDGRTVAFLPAEPLQQATTYTVTVGAGLESREGRPFLRPYTWHFTTGQTAVLYISWDDEGRNQLYVVNPDGSGRRQLTQERLDLLDYAVSPDGMTVAYAAVRDDGGSDLWAINSDGSNLRQLLDCPDGACSGAAWAPDGRRIIYERRSMSLPGAPPGPPRLWWLELDSRQTLPVFQDNQWLGLGARISANGQWLSYVVPLEQEIQMYNLTDGRTLRVTSRMGQPAVWHPQQDILLLNDIQLDDTRYAVHLYRVDLATDQLTNLSGEETGVNDNWPSWSPDAEWIAFGRRQTGEPMGNQIWLMRADGSDVRALTDDPGINYGPASWSPDGRYLLFQRFLLSSPGTDPGIWLLDVSSGQLIEIAVQGIQPAWLP